MTHHHPRVVRMHFGIHDKIVIDGVMYAAVSSDRDGHVLRRVDSPDLCEQFTHEQLADFWDRQAMKRHPDFYAPVKVDGRGTDKVGLSALSRSEQRTIFWRQEWCDRFRALEARGECSRSDKSLVAAIKVIAPLIVAAEMEHRSSTARCGGTVEVRRPPTPSTLRRWLRRYETVGLDPIVLRSRYGRSGNRSDRLHPEVRAVLVRVAAGYGDSRRPTKKLLREVLREEIETLNIARGDRGDERLPVPGMTALSREIGKLNAYQVVASREGQAKARNGFDPVRLGVTVTRPLERVEMDEWKVQLHTLLKRSDLWTQLSDKQKAAVKRTRVWVSVMLDCATRSVLAVHLIKKSPTSEDALATLRMALIDKTSIALAADCKSDWPMIGQFETVVMDTGSAYIADETRAAICDLRAEAMFPPAGLPQMRARIERVFSTIHTQFISMFHGRTFENVVAKGDYEAEKNAVINPEELYQLLVRYIVDVYHHTPHEGLGGETPHACWRRLNDRFGVPLVDRDTVGSIFGASVNRTLRREGIEVFGIMYAHDDLHVLHKQHGAMDVVVRVDQTDIGRIFVLIDDVWLTVNAKRRDLDSVSLDAWLSRRSSDREAFAADAAVVKPIADEARAEIRALANAAQKRANLMPLVYGEKQIREHAAVASRFSRDLAATYDEDIFEETYGIDEADERVSLEPKPVEKPLEQEPDDHDDFFFMED